ncbi:thioredoxin family protein [Ilyomonas limi]|uniref:Thioredoxin family protein n=1 Tax=Ilyomonas limi TaxID=2575867 RepID=A0A4V5UWN2_9BACT|nr:thioredoxin family protein [Ilyomonas limi]TKK72003.1 thioredoxin family protein [Ilyomonas limi]
MKTLFVLLPILFLSANSSYSQIHFEPLSWQQALGKAREENKMIFIDVYTTWCSYCKQMDAHIFSMKAVGEYHNEHFINLRIDAERGDGIAIRNSYRLLGFPTFLYLDPQGTVIRKTAGYQNKEQLLYNSQLAFSLFTKPSVDSLAKQ